MKKQILIVLSFLMFYQFKSQIKIDYTIDHQNKKAKVTLVNEADTNLVIPLDTSSLSIYSDDICLEISNYIYGSPYLGLNIKVNSDNEILESIVGAGKINDSRIVRKIKSEKIKYNKNIKLWQKTNGIKSFEDAEVNYYIFNNLHYLRPGEKIEKEFYFDLHNITNEEYLYHYYHIEDAKGYNVFLSFTIEDCVYRYLTNSQKEKLKGYKFFVGKTESNIIPYVENNGLGNAGRKL